METIARRDNTIHINKNHFDFRYFESILKNNYMAKIYMNKQNT